MKSIQLLMIFCLVCLFATANNGNDTLEASIYFKTNSFKIEKTQEVKLLEIFNQLPENAEINKIYLQGHTDDQGNKDYNNWLSQERAHIIEKFITPHFVSGKHVQSDAYGENKPTRSNKTVNGRKANRRVEVQILYNQNPVPTDFKVSEETIHIDPTQVTSTPVLKGKSMLHIPAHAFVDINGRVVTGQVEIKMKEYTNVAEIAFSGIPMHFHSEGEKYDFNSSGMFEIKGSCSGSPIFIAPDKTLKIDYKLAQKNDNTHFYYLNPAINVWKLSERIEPVKQKDNNNNKQVERAAIQEIAADGEWITNDANWHIDLKNDLKSYFIRWRTVQDTTIQIPDWAIKKGIKNNHTHFRTQYDTLYKGRDSAAYHQQIEKWRQQRQQLIEVENSFKFSDDRTQGALLAEGINAGHTYPDIVKGLNMKSFGVYNCDQILRVKNRVKILANYTNEDGTPIDNGHVLSMISIDYNGAFSFSPNMFECNPEGNVVLALFTKDKKLYIYSNEAFQKLELKDYQPQTFVMKDMTKEINSSQKLGEYLGL